MERAYDPIITRTSEALTITVRLETRARAHRSMTLRLKLADIRQDDLTAIIEAVGDEVGRRVKARWPELADTPLF